MIVAFAALCYGSTVGDISPPYFPDANNKVGHWSIAGSSLIMEDQILLVPSVQFKKGCMWTNCQLPKDKWSVQVDMQFYQGNGGSDIGVWFIDRFAADGDFFGGPKAFKGLAVLIRAEGDDENNRTLKFYIRESIGEELPPNTLDQPDGIFYYDPNEITPIDFEFRGKTITIRSVGDGSDDLLLVCRKDFTVNLKDAYMGITAMNNQLSMRVDVSCIIFETSADTIKMSDIKREVNFDSQQFSGKTAQAEGLRNPHLKRVRELAAELKNGTENGREATAEDVIAIADELTMASFDSISYAELNSFVTYQLLPYASKWHRRTLKIVDDARRARDVIGSAWNYTAVLLDGFNSSMQEALSRTASKVVELGDLIRPDDIAIELDDGGIEELFAYIVMAEFLVLLATFATKKRRMDN